MLLIEENWGQFSAALIIVLSSHYNHHHHLRALRKWDSFQAQSMEFSRVIDRDDHIYCSAIIVRYLQLSNARTYFFRCIYPRLILATF